MLPKGEGLPANIFEVLKTSKYFGRYDSACLSELAKFCQVESYPSAHILLDEGAQNHDIFMIVSGSAQVLSNEEQIIFLDRPGDLLGEVSVISDGPTAARVEVKDPITLIRFNEPQVRLEGSPSLGDLLDKVFLDILTEKLRRTTNKAQRYEGAKKALLKSKRELADTELSLNTQRDILDAVLRSMSEGAVVLEPNQGIVQVNEGFLKMLGQPSVPADLTEWPRVLGLYLSDQTTHIPANRLPMLTALRGELVANMEIFVKNPGLPEGRWLLATSRLLETSGEDGLSGSVVMFHDYTQKKNEEAALILAKQEAEEQARLKTNFLSMITHELGTPLNVVIGMSDLLLSAGLGADEISQTRAIKNAGEGLLTMVRNLLEYNQLETGHALLNLQPTNLSQFLEGISGLGQQLAGIEGLSFEPDFANDLGAVNTDRKRLTLVLMNLIHNSVKFSKAGTLTLGCKKEAYGFLFSLRDQGVGIEDSGKHNLFKPFEQVEKGLNRKYQGIGLGLILCKRVIELMGGKIWIESTAGVGTEVFFTLPLKHAIDPNANRQKAQAALAMGVGFAKAYPMNILVAEDSKANALLISKVLGKMGYQNELAINGLEALERVRAGGIDLVLMDIQMPVMDGLESTEKIMGLSATPPSIVALTANSEDQVRKRCQDLGMKACLTKPLRVDQLAEAIINLAPPVKS